jgi:hypothetical protein
MQAITLLAPFAAASGGSWPGQPAANGMTWMVILGWAAQHGLVQDDPVAGGFGPGEQVLAGEAESHGPFGEIFRSGGKAGYGDGPDVALSLQQAGDDLGFVGADQAG